MTITSGKTKASPGVFFFKLTHGILTKLEVGFPAGCAGLVGLRVLRGAHQLFPMVEGEWFVTDDFTIAFPIKQELESVPRTLKIEGYNGDEDNNHTITLRLSVDRPEDVNRELIEVVSRRLPERTEEYLQGIGGIIDVNQEVRELIAEGLIPSIDGVLELMRAREERETSKMSIADLVRL